MAHDKKAIYEQAEQICEDAKKRPLFIEDIIAYLPCSKATFYTFFPANSDELDALKEKLEANRVIVKTGIRAKLYEGKGGGAGLIGLYKVIGTDEERKRLSQSYVDHTSEGDKIEGINIQIIRPGEDIDGSVSN